MVILFHIRVDQSYPYIHPLTYLSTPPSIDRCIVCNDVERNPHNDVHCHAIPTTDSTQYQLVNPYDDGLTLDHDLDFVLTLDLALILALVLALILALVLHLILVLFLFLPQYLACLVSNPTMHTIATIHELRFQRNNGSLGGCPEGRGGEVE